VKNNRFVANVSTTGRNYSCHVGDNQQIHFAIEQTRLNLQP